MMKGWLSSERGGRAVGELLSLEIEAGDTATTVHVSGEIDLETAPGLRTCLASLAGDVVVDLTEVSFVDSQTIGLLIAEHKRRVSAGIPSSSRDRRRWRYVPSRSPGSTRCSTSRAVALSDCHPAWAREHYSSAGKANPCRKRTRGIPRGGVSIGARLIQRAAVAGTLAWTAPVIIDSLASPAPLTLTDCFRGLFLRAPGSTFVEANPDNGAGCVPTTCWNNRTQFPLGIIQIAGSDLTTWTFTIPAAQECIFFNDSQAASRPGK